jgi:opacity protein-like surface antigen
MYKKLIFIIVSFTFSVALADFKIDNFYLKKVITASKVSNIKETDEDINFNLSHEARISPFIGVGVGYYIDDNTRVDLILEHMSFNFHNDSSNFNYTEDDILTTGSKAIRRKAHGKSLMLNGYVDIITRDSFKIFIGAGAGAIQIKEKINHLISGNSIQNNQIYTFPLIVDNFTSKTITNFSHSFMIGTSLKVNSGVNLELMYSWRDFGKTKHETIDFDEIAIRNRYKGNHLSVGLRFDL